MGCKVLGIGWQGRMSAAHDRMDLSAGKKPDPTQDHPVTAEEGARRGQVVGKHVEHWRGEQDAVVKAPTVVWKPRVEEKA
jgi:lipopolysaccharide export system protein LptC